MFNYLKYYYVQEKYVCFLKSYLIKQYIFLAYYLPSLIIYF